MCLLKVRWWSFRFDTIEHKLIVQNHCSAGHVNSMPGDATMVPFAHAEKQAETMLWLVFLEKILFRLKKQAEKYRL
jgi:hypothetical protein